MVSSNHHPGEQDYWNEKVEVETSNGQRITQVTLLLRVYPETFNGYDAYMDIPLTQEKPDFKKVYSSKLGIIWEVVGSPLESSINGSFRGNDTKNNPPAWIFGLKKI
ncbi:hypothetical protein [Nostoc sp. C110]|uniref:hypothetical protein n=1 Tax=Nostoc sp. C110 TaxID=3349876 RepID=UPI00370D53FD